MIERPAIETVALTKRYGGSRGIEDVDLAVGLGEVFGFVGPNGAGKTTTIRCLLRLILPTAGKATVLGHDCVTDSEAVRRAVGYLPGDYTAYPNLTGWQTLSYYASLRGGVPKSAAGELIDRFRLDPSRRVGELSKGNRQKIGLVAAFMHHPQVLVLDEPTAGLDPLMQHEFQALVAETAAAGSTVFLSSHVLAEVEAAADRAAVIREGRIVAIEDVATLRRRRASEFVITFSEPIAPATFSGIPGVTNVHTGPDRRHLTCRVEGSPDGLVKAIAGYKIESLRTRELDLEDVFMDLYDTGTTSERSGAAPRAPGEALTPSVGEQ